MPRLHAIELLPDDAGRDAVRRDWQRLRDAGLPSQLDHRGTTNEPHVTLVSAPTLTADHEQLAATTIGSLLPMEVVSSGLAVLGGEKVSLVRLVDVPDALVRMLLDLRADVPGAQHPGWLPHLSLARRMARRDVPKALEALGHGDVALSLSELRRWDPEAGTVRVLNC